MIKSKKGQFFSFFLVMSVIFVLLGAYLLIGDKKDEVSGNPDLKEFGEKQKRIFLTYQEAEKLSFERMLKARVLWQKPVYDLAERGGFRAESRCGFDEINFWNKNKTYWCLDKAKIKSNLEDEIYWFFKRGYWDYLGTRYFWPADEEYTFFVKDNYLVGTAEETKNLTDLSSTEIDDIYELQNNFAVEMNYNASEYNGILDKAHILVESCYGDSDLNACVFESQINNFEDKDNWVGGECFDEDKKCYFTYKSDYEVLIKTFNTFSKLPINYKFGLNMGEAVSSGSV